MPPVQNSEGMADGVGGLSLAFGVLAALLGRERLGIGQEVASSQLGALLLLESYIINTALQVSGEFKRIDRTKRTNPLYCWYKCKDGKWIVIATLQSDRYWPTFCEAIGMPHLVKDVRFKNSNNRRKNCEELISLLDAVFIGRTLKEWVSTFESTDIMFSPVKDITDILHDPQVTKNEYIVDFDHPTLGPTRFPGYPVHFSRTRPSIRSIAPNLGEHTHEVLSRICGYQDEEIAELFEEEVV